MADSTDTRPGFRLVLLKVQGAEGPAREVQVAADRDRVVLGRADDCEVVVADTTVSRHHAEIRRTPDGYVLVDSGSANGVWVDDQRVSELRLRDGQVFRLGTAVLQFFAGTAPAAPTPPPAPRPAVPPPPPPAPPQTAGTRPPIPPQVTAAETAAREAAAKEAAARETAAREAAAREKAAREAAQRDAAAKEAAAREAAAREAVVKEAAAREAAARETAAREAAARETAAKEAAAAREKAAREAAQRDAAAKEAAARQAAAAKEAAAAPPVADGEALVPAGIPVAETTAFAEALKRTVTLVSADGNRPFLLDNKEMAWFVESGKVEVFTVSLDQGRATGSRTHFVSVLPGQLMFGMDLQAFAMGSGFLAVGRMGTTLRPIPVARLHELAKDPQYAKEIAVLVDAWVTELSRSLTKEIIPGPLVDVNLVGGGEETTLANQQRARSNKGVLWLEVLDGNLLFIGMEELLFWQEKASQQQTAHSMRVNLKALLEFAQRKNVLFPITTETWIEASNARNQTTRIRTYASDTAVDDAALWKGLEVFHQVLCQCEFINKKLAAVDEFHRLKTKSEYSRAAARAAYREIALVMEAPAVEGAVRPSEDVDPVLAACQLVGQSSGMKVIPHPETNRDARFDERVAAIVKASRFRSRAIALREEWWKFDHGPILAKKEKTNEPVALIPKGPSSYEAVNPVTGERRKVNARVAEELSMFGQVFYRPFPDGPVSGMAMLKFGARGLAGDLWMLVTMGIGLGILGSLVPIFTGKLFDTAIPQADRGVLLQYTISLFVAALVSAVFKITQSIATLRLQGKMDYAIEGALWDRLLNLPSDFFRKYQAGDLADRAAGIGAIRTLIAGAGIAAILGSLSSLFYVVLMFVYSAYLALLAIGLTLVFVAFSSAANYAQLRYQRQLYRLIGKITGLVLQFVSGVGKLRVAGAENHAFRVWARDYSAQRRLEYHVGRIKNNVSVFNAGFPILSSMAVFYMVMVLTQKASKLGGPPPLTTGDFIAFNAAYGTFLTAMLALSDASLSLLRAVPIFERLKPIITTEAEIDETKAYPGTLKGEIELSHCTFRYIDDGPWVVDDLTLKIRPGEFVAFVGSSGCGKSTLMRLMLGFEKPTKGSVYYDGQDLASLDLREVRQQLGVVLQDSKLLPADIFRNIIGTADLKLDDAWEAAKLAGLADDISELPMGMHTYVSEGGGGFSGGQKQRLLIARSLVRRPRIIFLDEATSALDNRSQAIVTESMERLQATRVVIAHRLSTIINADRICYMENGKIIEMGAYEELMKLGGKFYELARRQMA